jgi:protein SCO1/2
MKRSLRGVLAAGLASAAWAATWGANYFPNVPLTTQDGKTVRFYDDLLKDKKVVINVIYTRCGDSCPLETARLAQVQRILGDRVGRDIFFYSVSVDPVRDTPAELKAYAEQYHARPGWLFLTGKKDDIQAIRKKLGQAARAGENDVTDHTTTLLLGNTATGQWIRDSAMDNPQYLAVIIRDWLSSWASGGAAPSYAAKPALPAYMADRGAYLFETRCAACHTIGQGDGLGPDLLGVTSARTRAWLAAMIAAPNELLARPDPVAAALYARFGRLRMPNLRLGEPDVDALIDYLAARDKARDAAEPRR